MRPIFHLSFPVRDLPEAIAFYRDELGAEIGRQAPSFAEGPPCCWRSGHAAERSGERPERKAAHLALRRDDRLAEWEALAARMRPAAHLVEPPRVSYAGQPIEQAKLMLRDPSGNLIEVKAYRHPEKVLGVLAAP